MIIARWNYYYRLCLVYCYISGVMARIIFKQYLSGLSYVCRRKGLILVKTIQVTLIKLWNSMCIIIVLLNNIHGTGSMTYLHFMKYEKNTDKKRKCSGEIAISSVDLVQYMYKVNKINTLCLKQFLVKGLHDIYFINIVLYVDNRHTIT